MENKKAYIKGLQRQVREEAQKVEEILTEYPCFKLPDDYSRDSSDTDIFKKFLSDSQKKELPLKNYQELFQEYHRIIRLLRSHLVDMKGALEQFYQVGCQLYPSSSHSLFSSRIPPYYAEIAGYILYLDKHKWLAIDEKEEAQIIQEFKLRPSAFALQPRNEVPLRSSCW